MQLKYQQTLNESISFEGIGLHSGINAKVKIHPALENHGIVFQRTDISDKGDNKVQASFKNVSSAILCTTLKNQNGVEVSTVEHLLAALFITGIDNALIEINAKEVPIMDGSSKCFVEMIMDKGLKSQNQLIKYLKVQKKVELFHGDKSISIEPHNSLNINFKLVYKNNIIGNQENEIDLSKKKKLNDIYSSRTFCLLEDVEKIRSAGLAKGGSLDNAIVVDEDRILNKEGLRNPKEFVNHKILDLFGDFFLSGYRIIGKVKCVHGGHQLSCQFIEKLITSTNCYNLVNNTTSADKKIVFSQQPRYLAAV